MLDLGSLLMSMGLQAELNESRKQTEGANVYGSEGPAAESTNLVVDGVSAALNSVDSMVSAVANAVVPPTQPIANTLEACASVSAPSVDLSLPTSGASKKQ